MPKLWMANYFINFAALMETIFTEEQLRTFTRQTFLSMGCTEKDARLATDVLVSSDLRGIDSHGVEIGRAHV